MNGQASLSPPLRGLWTMTLLVWLGGPLAAQAACPPAKPVRFAAGASGATVAGGIPRGQRDCYTLNARQGQTLRVDQADTPDTNIVFQLYSPPWRIDGTPDDPALRGTALPGTAEGQDARRFSGTLPVSGDYLLVVGTSRGSGEYRLTVSIR